MGGSKYSSLEEQAAAEEQETKPEVATVTEPKPELVPEVKPEETKKE